MKLLMTALKGQHKATKCITQSTPNTQAAKSLTHSSGMSVIKADHWKNILRHSLIYLTTTRFDIPRGQTANYVYIVYHKGLKDYCVSVTHYMMVSWSVCSNHNSTGQYSLSCGETPCK